jgi:hypothetical protein
VLLSLSLRSNGAGRLSSDGYLRVNAGVLLGREEGTGWGVLLADGGSRSAQLPPSAPGNIQTCLNP